MNFGKSVFVWKGIACYNNDVAKTALLCKELGFDAVLLKIGDAANNHSSSYDDMELAASVFRQNGIEIGLWHYVYGGAYLKEGLIRFDWSTPEQEAAFANYWINKLNPYLYVIDAEKEYKYGYTSSSRANQPASRAGRFMNALGNTKCPIALSSFRYPTLHPEFPFSTFIKTGRGCDIHMPQVYWGDYIDAGKRELARSLKELRVVADIPFVPVGRAYLGDAHGNKNTIGTQLDGFGEGAKELAGCTFWVMDHIINYDPGNWKIVIKNMQIKSLDNISELPMPEETPHPIIEEELTLESLNRRLKIVEGLVGLK